MGVSESSDRCRRCGIPLPVKDAEKPEKQDYCTACIQAMDEIYSRRQHHINKGDKRG